MDFKGAVFDLDGTLLDSMGVWEQVDEDFLKKRGLPVPVGYGDAMRARGLREAAEYTVQLFGLPETPAEVAEEWLGMVREAYAYRVELMPHARRVLESYRARGIRLAVATCSARELVEPCLKRLGVWDCFDAVCTAESVGRGKEFPDIFLLAAESLGLEPGACAAFDDILPAIRSARAAGMYAVAVYEAHSGHLRGEMEALADLYIMSLAEAPGV